MVIVGVDLQTSQPPITASGSTAEEVEDLRRLGGGIQGDLPRLRVAAEGVAGGGVAGGAQDQLLEALAAQAAADTEISGGGGTGLATIAAAPSRATPVARKGRCRTLHVPAGARSIKSAPA